MRSNSLYIRQKKTGGRIVIPLLKQSASIFSELFASNSTLSPNPEFDQNIKTIGRLGGIYELITFSHKKGTTIVETTKAKPEKLWPTRHVLYIYDYSFY
ncbi:MAG: hypothetical protein QM726_08350 [Chitinophagaceae bacterium]